ncbi:eukaryotic translation initiation factor 2C, partial [Lecanoromycetidae sp. Uapishka_2]
MTDPLAHVQTGFEDIGHFPTRPDYGDQGVQRNVALWADYFRMDLQKPDLVLYRYDMTFEAFPPKGSPTPAKEMTVPEGKKLMHIIQCALRTSTFDNIRSEIATDFAKMLVSCKELGNDRLQTGDFKFWAENETKEGRNQTKEGAPRKRAIRFRMNLRKCDDGISVSKLSDYLASSIKNEGAYESVLPIVHALNIILGHPGKFSLETATPKQGKCFPLNPTKDIIEKFPLVGPKRTSGYLQGVRGYFANVRATTNSTLVNCNACCGAFYTAGPLVNLFEMFFENKNKPRLEEMKRLEKAIQGYERIQHFSYPVVNVGDKDHPTLVPPHVCNIIPGQMAKRKLDPIQTDGMIKGAVRTPEEMRSSINTDAFRVLGLKDNSTLESFGILLSSDMITLQGRVLRQPAVTYKTGSAPVRIDAKARWNLNNGLSVFKAGRLKNWGVLRIRRDKQELKGEESQFRESFHGFLVALRNTLGTPHVDVAIELGSHHVDPIDTGSDDPFIRTFECCKEKQIRFLMVVLPDNDASTYRQIKKFGDTVYGIHTVCVLGQEKKFYKTVAKAGQYFTNVALKINLKLNGINHVLQDHTSLYENTMVIGIDVTHPSPGPTKRTAPSVAAMVASIDKELAQWPVDLRINTAGKEMVELLAPMLKTRLELWQRKHGESLPRNLLIYRDGVSESQYQAVLEDELATLVNACDIIYGSKGRPKITLIIVGKRHHTRFFKKVGLGGCTNPGFGTVVDTEVTEARNWDFFLQSHHALQGTARPAHYFVLRNEIFTQDFVGPRCKISDYRQQLTYNMCYLFGRSTGPVSIPPPVYYADLACERSRCYGDFDDDILGTSSMAGEDSGNGPGKVVAHRTGPSTYGMPESSKSAPSKQGPGSTPAGKAKKEYLSQKQPQPTQGKTPDVMAGLSKKERARLFEERIAASQKAASAASSKAEEKKPEPKPEAKAQVKPEGKAEWKAEGKVPAAKGEGKVAVKDKPQKTAGPSKAEGKKPDTKSQAQKSETPAEEKKPKEKLNVEIHPTLVDTMFYI